MLAQLDHLIQQLERQAGASSSIVVRRPRPRDWDVTVFRDAPSINRVIYITGHGDTLVDALHDCLAEPQVAA